MLGARSCSPRRLYDCVAAFSAPPMQSWRRARASSTHSLGAFGTRLRVYTRAPSAAPFSFRLTRLINDPDRSSILAQF